MTPGSCKEPSTFSENYGGYQVRRSTKRACSESPVLNLVFPQELLPLAVKQVLQEGLPGGTAIAVGGGGSPT